jgi:predicted ribonuclease YlaK
MDALADKDLTVVYAGGAYGTGKSLLTNNYAL